VLLVGAAVICSLVSARLMQLPMAGFALQHPRNTGDMVRHSLTQQQEQRGDGAGEILSLTDSGDVPVENRKFLVNGWRWHTMSVIRDLNRFRGVVRGLSAEFKEKHRQSLSGYVGERELLDLQVKQTAKVVSTAGFVLGFNWKALVRVETTLFFPWLRKLLPSNVESLLKDYGTEHEYIKDRWAKLDDRCTELMDSLERRRVEDTPPSSYPEDQSTVTFLEHLAFLYQIDEMLVDLQQAALRVQSLQQGAFVPLVAAYVDVRDQERFNNKVVSSLGLLDSQVHLVSMFDALSGDEHEKELWVEQIPKIARSVLPLWRKRLYNPKVKGCFD
jgi:hypothetical protein